MDFAREIVARFHGFEAGNLAVDDWEKRHGPKKDLASVELPHFHLSLAGQPKMFLTRALAEAGLTQSATEARKLITQGGVRINQEKVVNPKAEMGAGDYLLQVGKLKAARVTLS
jgi:tyrosyl-tRNA synthetase